jgi:hypothetical protein
MATKDIKPSTETGLTRRQVLGKALKTGAGAVASDILDPALLGGLTDLITGKGGIVKVPASTLNQNVRKLLSLASLKEKQYRDFFEDAVSDKGVMDDITNPDEPSYDIDYHGEGVLGERNEVITDHMQEYLDDVNNELLDTHTKMMDITSDILFDLRDQGYSDDEAYFIAQELEKQSTPEWDRIFYKRFNNFRNNINNRVSLDSEIKELKDWAARGYYGSSSEVDYGGTLYDRLERARARIRSSEIPDEDFDDPTTILDKEIRKAIKSGLADAKTEVEEEPVLLPEEPSPTTIEDRLKDLTTTRTFKELRRALGKLGAPRPEAIEGPKPEAPKQIEGPSKSPVQMANIASALSRLKRATPLGAAAAMYQPSPAGVGSDIVPPYPLIRPQF